MKLKSLLLISTGAAVGYVFGTRAGQEKFEQLKTTATNFLHSRTVQDQVSDLADRAKDNADRAPSPANDLIKDVADKVDDIVGDAPTAPRRTGDPYP